MKYSGKLRRALAFAPKVIIYMYHVTMQQYISLKLFTRISFLIQSSQSSNCTLTTKTYANHLFLYYLKNLDNAFLVHSWYLQLIRADKNVQDTKQVFKQILNGAKGTETFVRYKECSRYRESTMHAFVDKLLSIGQSRFKWKGYRTESL